MAEAELLRRVFPFGRLNGLLCPPFLLHVPRSPIQVKRNLPLGSIKAPGTTWRDGDREPEARSWHVEPVGGDGHVDHHRGVNAGIGLFLLSVAYSISRAASAAGDTSPHDLLAGSLNYDSIQNWPVWILVPFSGLPALLTLAAVLRADFLGWVVASTLRLLVGIDVFVAFLVAAAGISVASLEKTLAETFVFYSAVFAALVLHAQYSSPLVEMVRARSLPAGQSSSAVVLQAARLGLHRR